MNLAYLPRRVGVKDAIFVAMIDNIGLDKSAEVCLEAKIREKSILLSLTQGGKTHHRVIRRLRANSKNPDLERLAVLKTVMDALVKLGFEDPLTPSPTINQTRFE